MADLIGFYVAQAIDNTEKTVSVWTSGCNVLVVMKGRWSGGETIADIPSASPEDAIALAERLSDASGACRSRSRYCRSFYRSQFRRFGKAIAPHMGGKFSTTPLHKFFQISYPIPV